MEAIALVATGAANLASVRSAFARLGAACRVVDDPESVRSAQRVVLPGVGAFGPASARLCQLGLADALRDRARAGRPLLAICLGLQLLFEGSAESPGASGLGVFGGRVGRFDRGLRVPQMGWSRVSASGGPLLQAGWAYYANSYRVAASNAGGDGDPRPGPAIGDVQAPSPPDGDTPLATALSEHGGAFVAAIERGPLLACQFHPELSGAWGSDLLRRWLEGTCLRAA